jgi:flagellar protein FliO/FliZ
VNQAATPAAAVPGFDAGGLVEMMLSLALVVGLIIALSWVIGRLRSASRVGAGGAIGVLAEIAVGPKERILLVRVGDRQALIGVSAAGVSPLSLLEQNIAVPDEASAPNFALKLREAMSRAGIGK